MDPATLRVIYGILAVVLLVLIILTRRKRLGHGCFGATSLEARRASKNR